MLQQYSTAIPLNTFRITIFVSLLLGGAFSIAALIYAFGLAWFFCRKAFGEDRLPNWSGMPGVYYRDALLIGVAGVIALIGLEAAVTWISAHHPLPHRALPAAFGGDLAARIPAISSIGSAISHALMFSAIIAAIAGFIAGCVKSWPVRILMFLIGAATLVGDWGSAGDYAQKYLLNCVLLGAIVFGVRWIAKFNLLGIFLVLMSTTLLSAALPLLKQQNGFYRGNGYAILAALLVLFGWPLLKWQRGPKQSQTS
jgi:hypothetical protein